MWHALECQLKGIRKKFEVLIWLVVLKKNENQPFDLKCNVVRTTMVSKDVGAREKTQVVQKCSFACPRLKL
jgi:hypothetical protein